MDSKGMHIRDQVVMDQALADSLAKGPAGPRYVAAREIVFGASAVEIVGRDLIFVADAIKQGGDAPFVVRARPLPPKIRVPGKPEPEPTGEAGKKGNPGQRVEIYCRHFEGVRIQSIGSAGGTGGKGVTGSKAIAACSHLPKQGNSSPKLECEEPPPRS